MTLRVACLVAAGLLAPAAASAVTIDFAFALPAGFDPTAPLPEPSATEGSVALNVRGTRPGRHVSPYAANPDYPVDPIDGMINTAFDDRFAETGYYHAIKTVNETPRTAASMTWRYETPMNAFSLLWGSPDYHLRNVVAFFLDGAPLDLGAHPAFDDNAIRGRFLPGEEGVALRGLSIDAWVAQEGPFEETPFAMPMASVVTFSDLVFDEVRMTSDLTSFEFAPLGATPLSRSASEGLHPTPAPGALALLVTGALALRVAAGRRA